MLAGAGSDAWYHEIPEPCVMSRGILQDHRFEKISSTYFVGCRSIIHPLARAYRLGPPRNQAVGAAFATLISRPLSYPWSSPKASKPSRVPVWWAAEWSSTGATERMSKGYSFRWEIPRSSIRKRASRPFGQQHQAQGKGHDGVSCVMTPIPSSASSTTAV